MAVPPNLSPSDLVEELRAGMASGSMPAPGVTVPMEEALDLLADGIEPLADPELAVVMVGAPSVSSTFSGFDGLRAAWSDWGETFSELSVVIEDVREVPAGALILVRQIGATHRGAVPMEHPSAMLLRVGDGRVSSIEFHLDRDLAKQAANQAE